MFLKVGPTIVPVHKLWVPEHDEINVNVNFHSNWIQITKKKMGLALSSLYFMSLIIHCIVFYKSNSPGSIGMLKLPLYCKSLTGTGVDWPKKPYTIQISLYIVPKGRTVSPHQRSSASHPRQPAWHWKYISSSPQLQNKLLVWFMGVEQAVVITSTFPWVCDSLCYAPAPFPSFPITSQASSISVSPTSHMRQPRLCVKVWHAKIQWKQSFASKVHALYHVRIG